jgi:hypothetical protein
VIEVTAGLRKARPHMRLSLHLGPVSSHLHKRDYINKERGADARRFLAALFEQRVVVRRRGEQLHQPNESAENKRRHGIDFAEAQELWAGYGLVEIPLVRPMRRDGFWLARSTRRTGPR